MNEKIPFIRGDNTMKNNKDSYLYRPGILTTIMMALGVYFGSTFGDLGKGIAVGLFIGGSIDWWIMRRREKNQTPPEDDKEDS